jgi:hypothetical protein
VVPVVWRHAAPATVGVPDGRTLERVVCGALARVYPARAADVGAWLHADPEPPGTTTKATPTAWLAKWYAKALGAEFFTEVWRDEAVAIALIELLGEMGAWDPLLALVSEG